MKKAQLDALVVVCTLSARRRFSEPSPTPRGAESAQSIAGRFYFPTYNPTYRTYLQDPPTSYPTYSVPPSVDHHAVDRAR